MRQLAFTIVELIIAIAVGGILLTVALPNLSGLLHKTSSVSEMNRLLALVQYARSKAIENNSIVTICPNDDGHCGVNWRNGVLIKIGEHIVRHFYVSDNVKSFNWRGGFGGASAIQFNAMGVPVTGAGSFYLQFANHETHKIIISASGRARIGAA